MTAQIAASLRSAIPRIALAIGAVVVTTAVLVACDADLAVAQSILLLVVIGAAVLGYAAGLAAAFAGFATLNYYFTDPRHSLNVRSSGDLVALVAFVLIAIVVAAVVARLNDLRVRSQRGEREALLQLQLIDQLASGVEHDVVLDTAARELVDVFGLGWCEFQTGDRTFRADGTEPAVDAREFVYDAPLTLRVGPAHELSAGDAGMLDALTASLANTLERIRLDGERREQRLRAELDRSRAGFLTAVTHDLRTPLASIKAGTATLLRGGVGLRDDERTRVLQVAHDEATRLERLVTNVLELTRIRAGGVSPQPVLVSVADLAGLATQRLQRVAGDRAVSVRIDADIAPIHVDPAMSEHVVVNLLENALLYSPPSAPVEIWAVPLGDMQELWVVDHGRGIPAEDRERIFEEFVRLDSKSAARGTGLGLAIVRSFVELNGGQVRCEETPGGGSTFVVRWPTTSGGSA